MAECLLLAQSGHSSGASQCPLSGVKQTSHGPLAMSASDPKRTLAELNWTSVQLDFVSRGPNNLPSVARVHQRSDDAYDRSLDFFHSRSMTNFAASFANLGIICCAALSLLCFTGLGLTRDLDGKYANSPLNRSGSTASQAGEGLAAQSLMVRASRMWIGIRKMENIECGLTANGSRCRPTRW